MSNFAFLKAQSAYASFAPACVEAEGFLGEGETCALCVERTFLLSYEAD